ncbi:MAG TPA: UvrD-helicase domain-containing protein [Firmicutes bacterium]|jgi:uncharacterized protein (TIGR00375 family)|nr:UvrD-helicase domain-containing protein [Bacillota bacterium]
MKYWADLHIHSRYSIATSKDCCPEHLELWARRKGLTVIGTGDFTHPVWREEIREKLMPAGDGLWRLKPEYRMETGAEIPGAHEVRFIISGEISLIYKKNGRTRKIHHLLLLPGLEEAERLAGRLEKIGNIAADGRPILGLDSRALLEMTLETCAEAIFIPAHIWTPHFSLFGANSGFDTIEECFEDLTPEITALETGLSSDPAMNWQLSALDRFLLVSNSDAHSPANLGREANLFATDLSYPAIRKALTPPGEGFLGTLEFFPEEGKYHWDGHRACGIRWAPAQTREHQGKCPVCGRKVTTGVLHRVEVLADRAPGEKPAGARRYERLVPLAQVIAAAEGVGVKTKKVENIYWKLVQNCGPELVILRETPLDEILKSAGPLTAEGIRRVRRGLLEINPGFDGEYGQVRIFQEGERQAYLGQAALFALEAGGEEDCRSVPDQLVLSAAQKGEEQERAAGLPCLNPEQKSAVTAGAPQILVVAGPGTGKTRTLLHRVEFLLGRGADPAEITCVTFTRKAAAEMRERLERLLTPVFGAQKAHAVRVGTFHQLCLDLLRKSPAWTGGTLVSEYELAGFFPGENGIRRALLAVSRLKNSNLLPDDPEVPEEWRDFYRRYQEFLREEDLLDYDEILVEAVRLLREGLVPPEVQAGYCHLLVDEFQDVTPLQYRLIKLLAETGATLFVIGDPDQSIYGFRGADATVFADFRRDYPAAAEIRLRLNYRSTPVIISAAQHLISRNPAPGGRALLEPARPAAEGPLITYLPASGETAESIAVVREIIRLVGGTDLLSAHGSFRGDKEGGSYSFGDLAVLFRTGRQAEALEKALCKEGLPYKVAGEKDLFYLPRVRETVTFLHSLVEEEDRLHLAALGLPCFFPGQKAMDKLEALRRQDPRAFRAALALENQEVLPPEVRGKINSYHACRKRFQALLAEGVPAFLGEWIKDRGWEEAEEMERLRGMAALSTDPADFLARIIHGKEQDLEREGKRGPAPEYIWLMTIHAAKGLEFPVVLITGLEEGLLPLAGEESPEEIEEERRLFYVGLTRAQREVILFSAGRRRRFGSTAPALPSRFLQELPEEKLQRRIIKKKPPKPVQPGLF